MIKIVEVKETISDGNLLENIYDCENYIRKILSKLQIKKELNFDEYRFLYIVIEKIKHNLGKIYEIIK